MDRYDLDWRLVPKTWKVIESDADGVSATDVVTFHGTRGGSGEIKVNGATDPWGKTCTHDANVDVVTGKHPTSSTTSVDFTITRKVILVCEVKSGGGSWTAEEGG